MGEPINFSEEAIRLARKAEKSTSPSEKRMLETQARFYEVLAEEAAEPAAEAKTPEVSPE